MKYPIMINYRFWINRMKSHSWTKSKLTLFITNNFVGVKAKIFNFTKFNLLPYIVIGLGRKPRSSLWKYHVVPSELTSMGELKSITS